MFSDMPTQQEMEGIQMVMTSLEAANLSMNANMPIKHEPTPNGHISFQDHDVSNLPTHPLSPKLPPHIQPPALPFTNEMHQVPQENVQSLFPQQPTSHPGSATTTPPHALFHFPSPTTNNNNLSGNNVPSVPADAGNGGQALNSIQSTLTSPVNSTFNHNLISNLPASAAVDMMGIDIGAANGQRSDEHVVPSGYVTPQSSGPGLLDFPPNIQSSVNPSQSAFTPPSGVGDDRNFMILE
jgi:hypothetical protein